MELRVLQYFLAVAREESITKAAASLHLSQPTLSRQIKDLEDELGKKLLIREARKVTLTDEGILLKNRAEEILQLVHRTENDITSSNAEEISGKVYLGAGETDAFRLLTQAEKQVQEEHTGISFDVISGGSADITEKLDRGLIDFALVFGPVDSSKFNLVRMPVEEKWGVLMRRDDPMAKLKKIHPKDIAGKPLILSKTSLEDGILLNWMHQDLDQINLKATYNLIYNGSRMVLENIGYAFTIDHLINVTGDSEFVFRPLDPSLTAEMHFIWKKYQVLSKAAQCYLDCVLQLLQRES